MEIQEIGVEDIKDLDFAGLFRVKMMLDRRKKNIEEAPPGFFRGAGSGEKRFIRDF